MLAREFKEFYKPYFYNNDLSIIPVESATVLDAENLDIMSSFNTEKIPKLSTKDLTVDMISKLPTGTTFVNGDPNSRLHEIIEKLAISIRPDLVFMSPTSDMTEDWLLKCRENYLCSSPWTAHVLLTMNRLVNQGVVCGCIGPFIDVRDTGIKIVIEEKYDVIPVYLFGLQNQDTVIPNLSLCLVGSFVSEISKKQLVGKISVETLLSSMLTVDDITDDGFVLEKNGGSWYPELINRNWQNHIYHQIGEFL